MSEEEVKPTAAAAEPEAEEKHEGGEEDVVKEEESSATFEPVVSIVWARDLLSRTFEYHTSQWFAHLG